MLVVRFQRRGVGCGTAAAQRTMGTEAEGTETEAEGMETEAEGTETEAEGTETEAEEAAEGTETVGPPVTVKVQRVSLPLKSRRTYSRW